jgi:hypothetical protein
MQSAVKRARAVDVAGKTKVTTSAAEGVKLSFSTFYGKSLGWARAGAKTAKGWTDELLSDAAWS